MTEPKESTSEHLFKVKDAVEEVMTQDPKTRDHDSWLILQVLRKMGYKVYIDYSDLKNMPSFESITRARRYIQNTEGKLVPSEKVDKRRAKLQEEYHEHYG